MAAVNEHEFTVSRGEGIYVFGQDGRRYIDAAAGLWYCHVGHGRQEIVDAVSAQMRELECYSTFGDLVNPPASRLSSRLAGMSDIPDARVFMTLGGGDGIETAAKLARMYWSMGSALVTCSAAPSPITEPTASESLAGIETLADFGP
jgi:adenosylmethionine-8-amino-7-oxononanoate aminotransferase